MMMTYIHKGWHDKQHITAPRDWVKSAQYQMAVDWAHQAGSSTSLQTADDLSSLAHTMANLNN